jgi:hypothetical protein
VVEDDELGLVGQACRGNLLHLSTTRKKGGVGPVSPAHDHLHHLGTCGFGQGLNLAEVWRLIPANLQGHHHGLGVLGDRRLRRDG